MDVSLFDFDLPEDLIALRPVNPRDSARLLVVCEDGSIEHRVIRDLPELLRKGDMLVVNDTKVIRARLRGRRTPKPGVAGEGPSIEIMLHKRTALDSFLAFARPARKLSEGDVLRLGQSLDAQIVSCGEAG